MNNSPYPVKKNGVYPLKISSLAFGGRGVSRYDDYVIFVKRAIPGDIVNARIIKRKKSYAEAIIESFIEKSPERIQAPCPHFEYCGGCTWQNMDYHNQLKYKTQIVADAVKHISDIHEVELRPILASDKYFHYRNKMEFSFADKKWLKPEELDNPEIKKDFALGLHVPGTFDKVIHIENCLLQNEQANQILEFISGYVQAKGLVPYGLRSNQGYLRFLVIRQSDYTKKIMVNIVTAYRDDTLKELAKELINKFTFIAGVINNINSRKAQIAVGEEEFLLAGNDSIEDKIGPFIFNISANSFFQTNTRQAELLYNTVIEFAELSGDETVWDLYSGTGTISLYFAQKARHVLGLELVRSAVENAIENAQKYHYDNISFVSGDVINNMHDLKDKPDVIVTDPPRAGMHEKVVNSILEAAPKKIIYVSCNPTTMARDLQLLKRDYTIDIIQPIDMFPQTYHIECVTRLIQN